MTIKLVSILVLLDLVKFYGFFFGVLLSFVIEFWVEDFESVRWC